MSSEPEFTEPTAQPDQPTPDLATPTQSTTDLEQSLPLDLTFEILKNPRRRLVLKYLRDSEDTVRIGTLAEHIAAIENDIEVRELNAQQRKRVYIGLYQCHLPKMDDAGIIDFNQSRGLIDLTEDATPLFDYIDTDDADDTADDPPTTYVLGLAAGVTVSSLSLQFVGAGLFANALVVGFLLLLLLLVGATSISNAIQKL
mgnify:CR=1 FL=1